LIHIYGRYIHHIWYCGAFQNGKVFATSFGSDEKKVLKNLLEDIPYGVAFQQIERPTAFHKSVIKALSLIYEGKTPPQSFPLNMERLPKRFQQILKAVITIPCGYVATYGGIAKACNTGARVVGKAMASNPFPLLVPCHRVVRSNLTLGGYGLGINVKQKLLEREQRGLDRELNIQFRNKILTVFPVERVLERLTKRVNVKFPAIS